ncbi:hypothetical protein R6242_14340 [Iodobacter sp. CM08]|uniref:hypothetical protein n=1 Tax=Iodobacter sp. CM08 TaxID=3085902 RepID=UPI002982AC8B|nr:hypothetical protein [Iodobacter sp. CM08]MDW5417746.1 hypothetical protein [Iodobacter sp. CM08]
MFKISAVNTFWREITFTECVLANEEKEFSFKFEFKRLSAEELEQRTGVDSKELMKDFLSDVVTGWDGIAGEDGEPLPFTADNFKALLQVSGVGQLAFRTYVREVGVLRTKN